MLPTAVVSECHHAGMTGPPTTTFRLPTTGLVGVFALALCATPVAFAAPGLQAVYLVPLALGVWLLRTRTVVDPTSLRVHGLLRTRRLSWHDVTWLRVSDRAWVRAVLADGAEVALPAVRARDLPRLAAASAGRIPDPTAARDTDQDDQAGPRETGRRGQ
jgi:hypothetical protein